MEYQNLLQNLAKFMEKFTQLLASISLFSFLFSYYSSYFSSFFTQYSLNSTFSTFPFQLLSHAMDKNYVFLICNGIFLVLLANTNSSEEQKKEEDKKAKAKEDDFLNEIQEAELPLCIGSRASYLETSKEVHVQHNDHEEVSIQLIPLNVENSNMTIVEYKQDEITSEGQDEEKEEGGIGGEECSRTYEIVEADHNNEQHEMDLENDFFSEEDQEVEESDDEPLNELSTEELNKKFEEFIRKMKEEIRIEARQQLVLVK